MRRGSIVQPQLWPLPPAPVVDLQPPGQMEPRAAVIAQPRAQIAVKGAKGDGIQVVARAVPEAQLQMCVANPAGMADGHVGQGVTRGRGAGAPAPRYALPDMAIRHARRVGDTHLKLSFGDGAGNNLDAIAFGAFDSDLGARLSNHGGARFHLAGRLEINNWGGRQRPQLRLDDAAPAHPG